MRQAAVGLAALLLMAATQAGAAPLMSPPTSPQAEFEAINREIASLWASNPCFQYKAQTQIHACWSKSPDQASTQDRSRALVARLAAIQDTYPARSVILKSRLNLLTKAGLFCDERDFIGSERELLAARSDPFLEWIGSLDMCARTTGDFSAYDEMRGALSSRLTRFDRQDRITLLKIWFNSFLFQYSVNGDLAKAAAALNDADVDGWKLFTTALKKDLSWQRFPADSVSKAEMMAAKRALYAA